MTTSHSWGKSLLQFLCSSALPTWPQEGRSVRRVFWLLCWPRLYPRLRCGLRSWARHPNGQLRWLVSVLLTLLHSSLRCEFNCSESSCQSRNWYGPGRHHHQPQQGQPGGLHYSHGHGGDGHLHENTRLPGMRDTISRISLTTFSTGFESLFFPVSSLNQSLDFYSRSSYCR